MHIEKTLLFNKLSPGLVALLAISMAMGAFLHYSVTTYFAHISFESVLWAGLAMLIIVGLFYLQLLHKELLQSEWRARHVLQTAGEGYWLTDARGGVLDVNQAYADLCGYPREALLSMSITDLEVSDQTSLVQERVQALRQTGHASYETRHRHRDGRLLDVEVSCTYDASNHNVITFIRDISGRKSAELAIRELSELNRLIIENSESGIMVHKASGECIVANEAAARIVGTDRPTLLQHNFRKSTSWRESGELGLAEAALRTGKLQLHNRKMHTIYGRDIWCMAYLSRLSIQGEPYLLTMFTDIMQYKMAEDSMRLAKEHAEEMLHRAIAAEEKVVSASEDVQRRLGQELHDGLGQKLTGAALLCKALEGRLASLGLAEAGDASRIVTQLNDAVNEARGIARGLLPVEFQKHGLIDALQQLADKVPEFSGMNCNFDWDMHPKISVERAFNLYRIAQEAINNAVKHSRGNEIVISLQCDDAEQLRLSISDNGRRLAAGADSHIEGDGIGILVMQFRARLIGADLTIHSDSKTGTEVVASLAMEQTA